MATRRPFEMSADAYRKAALGTMAEKEWRATVIEHAQYQGWEILLQIPDRAYQVLAKAAKTDRSLIPTLAALEGFPDLWLGHPRRGINVLVELKTAKGRLNAAQQIKHPLLASCGAPPEIWRPGQERVAEVLGDG